MSGLIEIADELRINHGNYYGTGIPYVATLDVVSTWIRSDGTRQLVAHECKPSALFNQTDRGRMHDRLKMTGLYCERASIPRFIFHAEHLPRHLSVNLDALAPRMTVATQQAIRTSRTYQTLLSDLDRLRDTNSPSEVVQVAAGKSRERQTALRNMLQLAIWHQDVDHDLTQPLELHHPLLPGGQKVRESLRAFTLGESA